MILVEVVAHASLKTFGHFALSCGCGVVVCVWGVGVGWKKLEKKEKWGLKNM
jgi:hypothetical protein